MHRLPSAFDLFRKKGLGVRVEALTSRTLRAELANQCIATVRVHPLDRKLLTSLVREVERVGKETRARFLQQVDTTESEVAHSLHQQ